MAKKYRVGRAMLRAPRRDGASAEKMSVSADTGQGVNMPPTHKRRATKKTAIVIVIAVCVLIMGTLIVSVINNQALAKVPDYQTILPNDKSINQLGGWKRISPPKESPAFAYGDSINGIGISVSQQPLPESFKSDPAGKIAQIAKQGYYSSKIQAGTTTLYVGTSVKGPQSAILTKNGLLILIKSQQKIDDSAWATYVESLK